MRNLLTVTAAFLVGLAYSVLAVAAPPDDYAAGLDASRALLGGGVSVAIKACQDQAEIITLAPEAKARELSLEQVGPTFDMTPAGPVARRVYAGELAAHPAALDHLNGCLTRLRVQLE